MFDCRRVLFFEILSWILAYPNHHSAARRSVHGVDPNLSHTLKDYLKQFLNKTLTAFTWLDYIRSFYNYC